MNQRQTTLRFVALLMAGAWNCDGAAHGLPELRAIIAEQLVYPRDARYTIAASLPAANVDAATNAQWSAIAERLREAGFVRLTRTPGRTVVEPLEQSLDVVVPSTNLRYEITALNIVLGRWEIDAAKAAKAGDVTVVHGRKRLAKRTRGYDIVVKSIALQAAGEYSDRNARWEISGQGTGLRVEEKLD